MIVPEVTNRALQEEISRANRPTLIDVREADELEISVLPHVTHIPLAELPSRLGELDSSGDYVIVCRTGGRSARATAYMLQNGFTRVRNLVGGMNGWAAEIDPSMHQY